MRGQARFSMSRIRESGKEGVNRDEPGVQSKDFILKVRTLKEYCRERVGKMNQNVCVSHDLYLIHASLTICRQHDMPVLQRRPCLRMVSKLAIAVRNIITNSRM